MLYDSFVILALATAAIMIFEVARFFQDYKGADFSDTVLFIIACFLSLWAALNSVAVQFVLPDGTTSTYTGEAMWLYPFFGCFLIAMGMIFVSLFYAVKNWNTDQMYPLGIEA